ncbi:MAG: cation:proton antiporter [Myxococcota bacterium]|nr:cation:proton antiporter [Myxococcota bacterium]
MEPISISAAFPISLSIAFLLGFGAKGVGLPPLVGYLVAGFLLHALGVRADDAIEEIADLGVLLLLFTIGLKLKLKSLARPEVWAGASLHAAITVAVLGLLSTALAALGLSLFADLDLATAFLIAFALSFSSTVFAVKVLEEKGELSSLHGRTAIGILIMQDVFAVVFMTLSTGKVPSPWAFALVAAIGLRPLFGYFLDRVGHGELLPLFGLFASLGLGVSLFELVGMKPDLGALVFGMLMAGHKQAKAVADALFSFKEIFLVGFFLNIGLSGYPSLGGLGLAVFLVLLLPLKVGLFFLLLTRFRLRARSSLLASLSLASYSEFGLIVGGIGMASGWIAAEWVVVIAIALSISFVVAAPLNDAAHRLYARHAARLRGFETETRHPEDQPVETGDAEVAIFGMGRIGAGAYDYARERFGEIVVGVDSDMERVAEHRAAGRNVVHGDATDSDFWERNRDHRQIEVVLLAMPEHSANLYAIRQLVDLEHGFIAAVANYPEDVEALEAAGANMAFDSLAEAGAGFVAEVVDRVEELARRRAEAHGAS